MESRIPVSKGATLVDQADEESTLEVEMIPRRRGEKPQKGNPHKLTRDQHVIPVATLIRFAGSDGLVEVHLRDGRIEQVPTKNQIFSVDRLWDERAEAGYMRSVEDDFQALVDALEAKRLGPLSPLEHRITTRFWSLWTWRNHFIDFPARLQPLRGIEPDKLSKDQREIIESKWCAFIAEDRTLSPRVVTGNQIETLILRDETQYGNLHWGILRACEPHLILPDRPGSVMLIPASPRLLLAADNPDSELNPSEIRRANGLATQFSRHYVVVAQR